MRKILVLSTLLLTFCFNFAFAVTNNTGVVDSRRIFAELNVNEEITNTLEKELGEKEEEYTATIKSLQKKVETLKSDGDLLSDSDRKKKEREIASLQRDAQRLQNELQNDSMVIQQDITEKYAKDLEKAAEEIAKQKGYDMVLQKVFVVVSPNSVDITDQVIDKLKK